LSALAPRLSPTQARRAIQTVLAAANIPPSVGVNWSHEASILLARLSQEDASNLGDTLLTALEEAKDPQAANGPVCALTGLAPRLEAAQVKRAWKALTAKVPDSWGAFAAFLPRLDPESRDKYATAITATLLDYSCSDAKYEVQEEVSPDEFTAYISSPRSLARLLSHPGCVDGVRQSLLQRFEELVFYDGRRVWKPQTYRGGRSGGTGGEVEPLHKFRNVRDAAAWIQKNWPDFDLETNCPTTWRGSR
jgi:hypothetical protein